MKTLKKLLAIILVFTTLFGFTGCSPTEGDGTLVGKAGTAEGESAAIIYAEMLEEAIVINKGDTLTTENGNTMKFQNAKDKGILFAPLAFITVIIDIVAIIFGGVISIPGWYSPDKDHKIIDAKFKFTNRSESDVFVSDIAQGCLAKVGDNYYNATLLLEKTGGMSLETYTYDDTIRAGKSKNLHFLVMAPAEVFQNNTDIDIVLEIDNSLYVYDFQ